ncbi:MAG: LLM class F420-dependent oxidoreductase [Myxococcota bacterium]
MSLQIGAVFPTCEIGNDPAAIRDYAQAAEELGYSHITTYDHVLGAVHEGREPALTGPYRETDPFHEPFVLFGYLAGVTQRIRLVTGVLILPQRQTVLVAKQAAELAVLSGGRFTLGVGTGWNWVEYESLGEDYASRGSRLDEQLELLRQLWESPVVDFEGEHHRVDRTGLLPLPPSRIPIWMGGFSPPAVRRAARIGDGFLFGAAFPPMLKLCSLLHAELEKTGRGEGFEIDVILHYSEGEEAWRSLAEKWKQAGATHFSMRSMDTGVALTGEKPAGLKTVQDQIGALERFISVVRDVGPDPR